MTPTIPSTLSKMCLVEIISVQEGHLQSLIELPIQWRSVKILNVQTTGVFWGGGLFLFSFLLDIT